MPIPVSAVSLVTHQGELAGVYVGALKDSWKQAVTFSPITPRDQKTHPFKRVLACSPTMYHDLWTGSKCM